MEEIALHQSLCQETRRIAPNEGVATATSRLGLRSTADLKLLFSAQCKLIAARVENDKPLDLRSLRNLIRLYRQILAEAQR